MKKLLKIVGVVSFIGIATFVGLAFYIKPPAPPPEFKNFIINGVKFKIPRDYLFSGKNEPDGEVDGVSIIVTYPDFTPSFKGARNDDKVLVSIDPRYSKEQCEIRMKKSGNYFPKSCGNRLAGYFSRMGFSGYLEAPEKHDISKIQKVKTHENLGLTEYGEKVYDKHTETYRYMNTVLIKGNLLNPDYWLSCPYKPYTNKIGKI